MSAYLSAVLADSPIHYWRCADGVSQIVHDIGSSPSHGRSSVAQCFYTGIASDGGSFCAIGPDGCNIKIGVAFALSAPFSAEFWYFFMQDGASGDNHFSWQDSPSTNTGFVFSQTSLRPAVKVAAATYSSPTQTVPNQWHYLAVTNDAATVRLYVDGVQMQSGIVSGAVGGPWHAGIGGEWNNTVTAVGQFYSECAIYSSALSAAQVLAHFNAAGSLSPPVTKVSTSSSSDLSTILGDVVSTYKNNP